MAKEIVHLRIEPEQKDRAEAIRAHMSTEFRKAKPSEAWSEIIGRGLASYENENGIAEGLHVAKSAGKGRATK